MNVIYPHDPTARTFKACRSCRAQKSKCRGEPGAPCERCQAAGRDCVFDFLNTKKRAPDDVSTESEASKRSRNDDLASEVKELRRDVNALLSKLGSRSSRPAQELNRDSEDGGQSAAGVPNQHPGDYAAHENHDAPSDDLDMLQLQAPITTVHALTAGISSPPSTPSTLASSAFRTNSINAASPRAQVFDDMVSRGIVGEAKARQLFHMYMAHANVFEPLFDPAVDTFESIRASSKFCFSAILATAMQVDNGPMDSDGRVKRCTDEATGLAAQTLFSAAADLYAVQGMIVLALYTEKNWYAIKHARQLANDLKLSNCVRHLLDPASSKTPQSLADRSLVRGARTWLVLHHIDQEASDGSGRLISTDELDKTTMRSLTSGILSTASDIRIASTIEIVQLRGRFLDEVRTASGLRDSAGARIRKLRDEVQCWYDFWDHVYCDHGLVDTSFQRSSLRIQKEYAIILSSSAIVSQLGREQARQTVSQGNANPLEEITRSTLVAITELLHIICDRDSYRWNLAWAPVYSVLMLTFITALALKLRRASQHSMDTSAVLSMATTVLHILDDYAQPRFAALLRNMIDAARTDQVSPSTAALLHHSTSGAVHTSPKSHSQETEGQSTNQTRTGTSVEYMHPSGTRASVFGEPASQEATFENHIDMTTSNDFWSTAMDFQDISPSAWDYQMHNGTGDLPAAIGTMFDFNAFTASMGN